MLINDLNFLTIVLYVYISYFLSLLFFIIYVCTMYCFCNSHLAVYLAR